MKKAKFMIVAVLLASTAFFSGCRKNVFDNSYANVEHRFEDGRDVTASKGNVHYRLQTLPQNTDDLFQWTVGRMNAVQLIFNATRVVVPPIPFTTSASIHQSVPLGVLTELGVIHPNTGDYQNLVLQVNLSGADTGSSVVLTGTYNQSGTLLPVRLVVSQNVLLQGQWPSAKILPPSSKEHVITLYMDLNRLINGVDPELIRQAFAGVGPNTETLISSETNSALFQAIFGNMLARDFLKVNFE